MDVYKERVSIRKYKKDMVPEELLEQVAEAGLYAASGKGKQSPIIITVTDQEMVRKLSAENARILGTENDPFYGAPAVFIVLANREVPTYVYDGSLVIGNMMNKAWELGLGTCWIHRAREEFDSPFGKEILKDLGIEGDYEGIGHVIIGYADGDIPEKKPLKEGRTYRI